MAKKKETKRFIFTKIGQMSLVESRDRHCDGDLTKSHSESFYIKKALYFGNYRNMFPKIGKTSNTLGM